MQKVEWRERKVYSIFFRHLRRLPEILPTWNSRKIGKKFVKSMQKWNYLEVSFHWLSCSPELDSTFTLSWIKIGSVGASSSKSSAILDSVTMTNGLFRAWVHQQQTCIDSFFVYTYAAIASKNWFGDGQKESQTCFFIFAFSKNWVCLFTLSKVSART